MLERIHKLLAHAGFGSRRACEEIIADERVTVNGKTAQVGDKADLASDDLRVDGHRVKPEPKVYYLVNKPTGYLTTSSDPMGRRKVADLLPNTGRRVYPVGRLDADSRGLVLMTNDGELAELLTHPSHEVTKTYEVEVDGTLTNEEAEKLAAGVWVSNARTAPARVVKVLRRVANRTTLEVTLCEGRNQQVRRMLARLGHKVRSLTRTRLGNLSLHGVSPGKFRLVEPAEIASLERMARAQKTEKPVQSAKPKAKPKPKGPRMAKPSADKKPRTAPRKTPSADAPREIGRAHV